MQQILNIIFMACLLFIAPSAIGEIQNGSQPTHQQHAEAIYKTMSLDEKIGQLLLPSFRLLAMGASGESNCKAALETVKSSAASQIKACGFDQLATYHIGSVFEDGGPFYNEPTLNNWQLLAHLAKEAHQPNQKDPLLLLGTDAVHGNQHVAGTVIFPQNINLGMTHNPALIREIALLTAQDVLFSGFNWVYAPTVAAATDLRWGRTYESYGQDPDLLRLFAKEYITGSQQQGALATVKHFFADGGTAYGLDEGNVITQSSERQLWSVHGAGYEGAVDANVGSMMVSYNAINGDPMHFGGAFDSINRFKREGITNTYGKVYRFPGFVVSDYNGAWRAAYMANGETKENKLNFIDSLAKTINSGVDMLMLGLNDTVNPYDIKSSLNYTSVGEVHRALKQVVDKGLISEERLKEAVTRILAVKLSMKPQVLSAADFAALQKKERDVALAAAQQSLVLLKNEKQLLPLNVDAIKNVVLLGEVDDIGLQNGGWTVNWQGQKGNRYFDNTVDGHFADSSGATTLSEGLKQLLPKNVRYLSETDAVKSLPELDPKNTIAVLVLAEPPYAEYMGDIGNNILVDKWYQKGVQDSESAYMPAQQKQSLAILPTLNQFAVLQKLRQQGVPVITVLYSGRPLVITQGARAPLLLSDAFIAAFLPGTLGGKAIANAMTGHYYFAQAPNTHSNTLSFPWPRDDNDIAQHFANGSLFPIGYGLTTKPKQ